MKTYYSEKLKRLRPEMCIAKRSRTLLQVVFYSFIALVMAFRTMSFIDLSL